MKVIDQSVIASPQHAKANKFGINEYEKIINSKDKQIEDLKQTVEIMDLKIKKLE